MLVTSDFLSVGIYTPTPKLAPMGIYACDNYSFKAAHLDKEEETMLFIMECDYSTSFLLLLYIISEFAHGITEEHGPFERNILHCILDIPKGPENRSHEAQHTTKAVATREVVSESPANLQISTFYLRTMSQIRYRSPQLPLAGNGELQPMGALVELSSAVEQCFNAH
ncbi:hypothetical protein UY3_11217 [Chelonia mydas]|uniref:Uncharacterized protein n=1 Tax=Chelonia mydas TaxID=8469 RepID=M7B7W5_CHEMY|nr:hypothetical protein UY3_11217 [Chelonia mydas]